MLWKAPGGLIYIIHFTPHHDPQYNLLEMLGLVVVGLELDQIHFGGSLSP